MLKGILGSFGTITIILVILKLCNIINWGWLWVFAPTWIPLAIGLVMTLLGKAKK